MSLRDIPERSPVRLSDKVQGTARLQLDAAPFEIRPLGLSKLSYRHVNPP
jgi:hypothetical protein